MTPSRGDDFRKDRDGDLLRRDSAEIEPGRRLDLREPRGIDAVGGERRAEGRRLLAAADEGDVVALARESGAQRGLVAASLRRDDDEAHAVLAHRQGITLDTAIDLGEGVLLGRRRAGGDGEAGPPRQPGDRYRNRARSAHDDLWARQDRLDQDGQGGVAPAPGLCGAPGRAL